MAGPLASREEIVRLLRHAGEALTAREIARRAGAAVPAPRFLELLDQLCMEGSLKRASGGRFQAPPAAPDTNSWEGLLSMNPRGFGFVTAPGREDLYVAPQGIGGALHGDRVRVSVLNRSSRGAEGRIEAVVARRNPRVAGVLRGRRRLFLEPDDTRVRGPIVVSSGARSGKEGDAAVVAITRFPASADENPEGELVSVLGVPGDPNTEVAKILVREQVDEQHPEGAVREAEAMAARVPGRSFEGRLDLREVPLPTIDPEDARDHDDAVWVERRADGYRAWIAIADVSEYVRPDSELDREAGRRGCTIYLPDRAIPMLPAALSSDLCSLLPERERLCLCVSAELDAEGNVKRFELAEGVMRSAAMLTYGGVARALGFSDQPPRSPAAEAFKKDLRVLDELSRKLRRRRMKRGALDLDLPEPKLTLDPVSGKPIDVERRTEDPGMKRAYNMIEELMLLANELVAQFLSQKRCPTIYRVHGRPDEAKLERLSAIAEQLNVAIDLDALSEPAGVGRFLRKIAEHPKRQVLEMLLLRSLKQAVYDVVNIGHFGLASDSYLHFTSPIRRYPDIEVHRSVKALLRGERADTSGAALERLRASAASASARERGAMDVEREVVDLYRALLMRDRIGDALEGTVTGVGGGGVYVTLDHPFVDVLVRFESMGPDYYEVSDDELSVVGTRSGDRVSLGDRVLVVIEDVAVLRRSVYARRVPPEGALSVDQTGRGGRRSKKGGGRDPQQAGERGRAQKPRTDPRRERRRTARGSGPSSAGPSSAGPSSAGPGSKSQARSPAPKPKRSKRDERTARKRGRR